MSWSELTQAQYQRFVDIMRQMDPGYDALTVTVLTRLLADSDNKAFYYSNTSPRMELVLLGHNRPVKSPDVSMLGWIVNDPLNVTAQEFDIGVNQVITKCIEWATSVTPPRRVVRAVRPKSIGYPPMRKLHATLKTSFMSPGGRAHFIRPPRDLGNRELWYIAPTS